MVKALFDTNILIDYLNSVPQAAKELDRQTTRFISIVTWMEVMVGASASNERQTRAFLDRFEVAPLDERVAEEAVGLRRKFRLKLPDAIIWASARVHGCPLVTRNTKDFPAGEAGIRMPYEL